MNGLSGSTRKKNNNLNTAVTQVASQRRLAMPSTTNLDLTETQTDKTSSAAFLRKGSLPMATFGPKKNMQAKLTVTGATHGNTTTSGGDLSLSSRAEANQAQ